MEAIGVDGGDVVVDPFAGSASAGSQVIGAGATFIGIEAHPLIAELGQLKFTRPGEPSELIEAATALADQIEPRSIADETTLVQRCFDQRTLGILVALRDELGQRGDHPWVGHLTWALLGTLRDVATVKVGWPYQRPGIQREAPHVDVRQRFAARARMMAEDLAEAPESPTSRVVAGDSTTAAAWRQAMGTDGATACVTSPPYMNNFDYADATRLEVYFLGRATTWAELCREIRSEMLVATTQQTRQALAEHASRELTCFPGVGKEVERLVVALATERRRRPRGKEYDRVVAPYFLGLARVLSRMHGHLQPGARCAWIIGDSAPYGIHVDTPGLLGALAQDLGYDVDGDTLLRDRGQRWRTNGTRHQVALSERLVTFTRGRDGRADV